MNEKDDAESAYGSETSSNTDFLIKKDTFTIEEPTTPKSQNRWKWIKNKLREYMILEAIFFLILIFLLITCYWIINQNQETQRMISSIQSQLYSIQKPVEIQKPIEDIMKEGTEKANTNKNKTEKPKITLKEILMGHRMKPVVELETNSKKTQILPVIPTVPTNSIIKQFNAASLIARSSIDTSLSSSSSLNPFIGFDQSSLVLVDRPEPPAHKAWCTSDENPVLTVDLGHYINPTAVSYQHSKWDGAIPDDAPKMYSVEACFDNHCMNRKPLFSNCEYNPSGLQEQICKNPSNDSIDSPVAKLQFRFHKNHGNTERTCVSLVRVYSETEVVPEQKLRRLEDTTTCIDLSNHYHNNPITYKFFTHKNCALLHSKGCCQECPECCEECEIQDFNPDVTPPIVTLGVICAIPFAFFLFIFCYLFICCVAYPKVLKKWRQL